MKDTLRNLFGIATAVLLLTCSASLAAEPLNVGVTLHPYYSWVANIAGDTVNLQTVIPDNVDPHSYQMRPQDIESLSKLDVIVVNTLGHDDYIEEMLQAAGKADIKRIHPNTGIPLIASHHKSYDSQQSKPESVSYNSHTYVAILGAIQQINTIASELGKLVPEHADLYKENARNYAVTLRKMLRNALQKLDKNKAETLTIASVHDGYAYLFQELGIKTDAVVQPRHGIEPSARQLADTINRIKKAKVNVLFTEVSYQKKYVDTIFAETGCRMYSLSHISNGTYSPEKFVVDMQNNLDTIVNALGSEAAL
nr:zinc ABC transporter substrate-binding protein [Desulfobulbaceae bacterium]